MRLTPSLFDTHYSCRTAPPGATTTHLKGAAAEAPRPMATISGPSTSTNEGANTSPCSPKKLHRKDRSATAFQPGTRAISNPYHSGIPKRTAFTPSKSELAVVDAPESKPERRRSFGATFSWHGRGRLESRLSTLSTKGGASTSVSEDGETVESGSGSGSESVPVTRKQKHQQPNSKLQRPTLA